MSAGNFKPFNQRRLVQAFVELGEDLHDWKSRCSGTTPARHNVVYDPSTGRLWLVPRRAGSGPNIETDLIWDQGKLKWA